MTSSFTSARASRVNRSIRWIAILLATGLWAALAGGSVAASLQEEDEDEAFQSEYVAGLVGELRDNQGTRARRVDQHLSFAWTPQQAPDPRLRRGPFAAEWTGRLMSEISGDYRIHARLQGKLSVTLGEGRVLEAHAEDPTWFSSRPIPLEFDYHTLRIAYASLESGRGRLQLYWSGPGFELEPMTLRLHHARTETPDVSFESGEQLTRALRCAACHPVGSQPDTLAIPQLRPGAWRRTWLERWLTAGHGADVAGRRMPDMGLSQQEAADLATFLATGDVLEQPAKQDPPANRKGNRKTKPSEGNETPEEAGQRLLFSRGCLACHRYQDMGAQSAFSGAELTVAGDKRPAAFFDRWLADPASINRSHRMPVFKLAERDRAFLATFLSQQRREANAEADKASEGGDPGRGRELFVSKGCAACHALEGEQSQRPRAPALSADARWDRGCMDAPRPRRKQPGYRLTPQQRRHIRDYFAAVSDPDSALSAWGGRRVIREQNCLACHSRGDQPGVARYLGDVLEKRPELSRLAPGLKPPSLNDVGDKLLDEALIAALEARNPRRKWLEVQMPRFRLSSREQQHIVRHFVESDRIPPHRAWAGNSLDWDAEIEAAGQRLVTADGFGCTSCHPIGKVKTAPNTPLNAMGPNLAELGKRIRRPWYERWVRSPARITPRMEMPSIKTPVPGVLDNDVHQQIAAVWTVLNRPGFRPPQPNPVRTLRRSGIASDGQPAVLATDVLVYGDQKYIKPLVIGLANRHNFLFDLERASLRHWWLGDTGKQRTQGKFWYWEAAGRDALRGPAESEVVGVTLGDASYTGPRPRGQFATEIDSVRHEPHGAVTFSYRVSFVGENASDSVRLRIRERWSPVFPKGASRTAGADRRIQAVSDPSGARVHFRATGDVGDRRWNLPGGDAWVAWSAGESVEFQEESWSLLAGADWDAASQVTLQYRMRRGESRFPIAPKVSFAPKPEPVNVTPGFEATRTPMAPSVMPTGLAWRPNGQLVVTSLKGRVWLMEDRDRDGTPETMRAFSDEFAAPFGVVARDTHVDVINKYALLRIWDRDQDGVAEGWTTLASGWGHTDDYHDWAVGLVERPGGGYFIATACQQDDRSQAAAVHRGEVLALIPPDGEEPAGDDARHRLRVLSRGSRFPMGVARNRHGDLVVTDNQGNYNPFNELNHVQPGRHFGFINKRDRQRDKPPLTPPAVNIPHPWTRSVNGICFLETPEPLLRREGPQFGPWEGSLIGCEYDSRRLIRMTLQRVDGTLQGCAYPFSYYHPVQGQAFLGPLVAAVSPNGELYVGGIRDSGWGGGANLGELIRMRPRLDAIPAGVAKVEAISGGFRIVFTRPVERDLAGDPESYRVFSYRRVATPEYGGPDRERRRETIASVELSEDATSVVLRFPELREGFVFEFNIRSLVREGEFFPGEAFYTLHRRVK